MQEAGTKNMNFKKSLFLALANIKYDKMRSLLTMLGIIIGVSAVIILISLMNGMMGMVNDQFAEIGTNTINVVVQDRGGRRSVSEKDFEKLIDEHPDLLIGYSPSVSVQQATVKLNGDDITTNLTGVNEQFYDIKSIEVEQGRFLQYIDVEHKQKVCVVGTYIQKELFGGESALGQSIKINGNTYKIVGVLKEKEDSTAGTGDEVIYIPYTNAITMSKTDFISSYVLAAINDEKTDPALVVIKTMLDNKIGDSDYYQAIGMKQILDIASTLTGTMKTLLVCIAGISLLVGGIGIMNIMLVSVTERTREIGIRKSLGAKGKDIMSQFVIEAGTISGVGGVIGIIVGSVLAVLFGNLLSLTAVPSLGAIAIAFSVSVGIGILFGYLPAKNAAKLNPIDALRHE